MSFHVHRYIGDVRDELCYFDGAQSNLAIVGSPAPSLVTATNRWEITGAVGGTGRAGLQTPGAGSTLTNRCVVLPELRVHHTLPSGFDGEVVFMGNYYSNTERQGLELRFVRGNNSSHYNIKIVEWDVTGLPPAEYEKNTWTGTTEIGCALVVENWAFRITQEGSTVKVWYNGTLELTITGYTGTAIRNVVIEGTNFGADPDPTLYITAGGFWGTYDGGTVPDHQDVRPHVLKPDGNLGGTGNNEFGGKLSGGSENCADTAKGDYANWNDWSTTTAASGDTDYNCMPGGDAGKEISTLSFPTWDTDKGINHVGGYAQVRINLASKNVDTYFRMQDDASPPNVANKTVSISNDTWSVRRYAWETHPDGSAWSRSNIGTIDLGAESISEDANDSWSAIVLEVLQVGLASGVAADRRRGAAQVI